MKHTNLKTSKPFVLFEYAYGEPSNKIFRKSYPKKYVFELNEFKSGFATFASALLVTREKNGALQYGDAHMIKEEETMATATLTAAMTAWKSIRYDYT